MGGFHIRRKDYKYGLNTLQAHLKIMHIAMESRTKQGHYHLLFINPNWFLYILIKNPFILINVVKTQNWFSRTFEEQGDRHKLYAT